MFVDINQNSDDWLELRAGKVTGSAIAKVMANYGKAFGDPATKLAVDIALHGIRGYKESQGYMNDDMRRGIEQEPLARDLYENEHFCTVTNGGFFDNGFTGTSPDGLVGDNGVIEIKSVIASTHYKRFKSQGYDRAYHWQLMFNMKESGRDWIDFISYCHEFQEDNRLWVQRVYAKDCEEDFSKIDIRLEEFKNLVEEVSNNIINGEK